jgi:hypothetical protein
MKRWDKGILAIPVLLAIGCENRPPSATANSAPSGERDRVVACYVKEYERTQGSSPRIDENERAAADALLSRYGREPRRACGAVTAAMSRSVCGLPVALASVVTCDRQQRERQAGPGVDSATKAEIVQRVNDQDRRELHPNQYSY